MGAVASPIFLRMVSSRRGARRRGAPLVTSTGTPSRSLPRTAATNPPLLVLVMLLSMAAGRCFAEGEANAVAYLRRKE
jgi:hypothetical protein